MFLCGKNMKLKKTPVRLICLLSIVALIGIDRLTKWLAVLHLNPDGVPKSINVIRINGADILNLTYCENTGAAFSILAGQRLFLILATGLLITGALIFLLSDRMKNKWLLAALTLIITGGTGNLIDRVFDGYVVDFIDVHIINFAIFNFADICAVSGALIFLFVMLQEEIKNMKLKKQSRDAALPEAAEANENE